jgi:hypothetical protein
MQQKQGKKEIKARKLKGKKGKRKKEKGERKKERLTLPPDLGGRQ